MKTKQFDKKLVLNKKTVAHLNNGEMNGVQGGIDTIYSTNPSCSCPQFCATKLSNCCAIG